MIFMENIFKEIDRHQRNLKRVKKFYFDEKSFNNLMNRIIEKDHIRFRKLFFENKSTNMWRILFIILDIVMEDGVEIKPYNTLTKTYPSLNLKYMDWIFSWIHNKNTLISIINPHDELIYQF